jgi:hypothetical protein
MFGPSAHFQYTPNEAHAFFFTIAFAHVRQEDITPYNIRQSLERNSLLLL